MWAHAVIAILGIWLMAASAVLGYEGSAVANSERIVGPVIACFGVVAIAGCTRSIRLWNIPFAVWLVISPIVMSMPPAAIANDVLVGIAVLALSMIKGRTRKKFGGGWIVLFHRDPYGVRNAAASHTATGTKIPEYRT